MSGTWVGPRGYLLCAASVLLIGCGRVSTAPLATDIRELARQSLAQIDGTLQTPGLKQPVDVVRDRWGVPHIYAQNLDDLFFAQGYVAAQDRLWQMEMWRRWREGRLSEIFGPVALDHDRRTLLLTYRAPIDDAEWTSYHPEGKRIFTAFATGVNAYIARNAENLPVEFKLTGVAPGHWTAETLVRRWTALNLASTYAHALDEIRLALDVAKLGAAEANKRRAPDPWAELEVPNGLDVARIPAAIVDAMRAGDSDPFEPGGLPPLGIAEPYRNMVSPPVTARLSFFDDPVVEGSNNWVVRSSLTTTGKPILANDPHRRLETPALRYYMHLNAPGWNVIGASEPPFVGIDLGHNERMAWGFTFAGTDVSDVYVEEVHPEDPNRVRWQDGWEPLRIVRDEIPVKGEAPRVVELKFSRHGPVFFEDRENRRAYAVRSVANDTGSAPYRGNLRFAEAAGCRDFFDRAMSWRMPSHNLICGDVEDNIAFQLSALTPDRRGWSGRLPVPGTGAYEWQGFRSDLPRELNPERGFIATANNNSHPPDYRGRPVMFHSTNGVPFSRITRIRQLLQSDGTYSIDDFKKFQTDGHSLRAASDIPAFQGWTAQDGEAERARALIASWDAVLTKASTPAALYVTWAGVADAAAISRTTPVAQRRVAIEAGLRKAVAKLAAELGSDWREWRYGRINQSKFPHALAREFDLPVVERAGGFGTVAATGVSLRQIFDLADWDRSVFSIAPGQSGQPESPYYGNLLVPWSNGEYFPLAYGRQAVDAAAAHRLTLRP
jgi:penicillin amidase